MKEVKVNDFNDFMEVVDKFRNPKIFYFRGQASVDWLLIPKAGREPFNRVDDKDVFRSWKRIAFQYSTHKFDDDWDWITTAQHHGLATRLLDWTRNPFVAAYFAVRNNSQYDSALYVTKFNKQVFPEKHKPFTVDGIRVFFPKLVVPRLVNQQGIFTIHENPKEEISSSCSDITSLSRIIIKKNLHEEFLSRLNYLGINEVKLFPDLDGVSRYIEWTIYSGEYWNQKTLLGS